ncbi:ParB family transcriptional regulator, chromosome partitioning protein [Marmoricola sp. URHA0025 HA25]
MTDQMTDPSIGHLIDLDPATLTIATNVRTDVAEDKDFANSIKTRGVLEPVTVYHAEDGTYAVLRGQRRTLTAAKVGTPSGTIPCRVVARPEDADRIGDQMVENIHRAGMRQSEILDGVEQLALLGVSAAQITKRVALRRAEVDAALAVASKEHSRTRVDSGDLTLEQAAIYAEFEGDDAAIERLDNAARWGRSLEHTAQRLRDEAVEREADAAAFAEAFERLTAEGLPVLSAEEAEQAEESGEVLRISRLVTAEGEPVPEEEWPYVPSARVQIVKEWIYPDEDEWDDDTADATDGTEDGASDEEDRDDEHAEPYQACVPVWVVTDLDASGLRRRGTATDSSIGVESEANAEARAEAKREERRRVIANNKAWTSAEAVRRDWVTTFLSRKTPPKGAEALICEAVVTGAHFLYKAMENNHPMLRTLSGVGAEKTRWDSAGELATMVAKGSTPKTATMTTLAAVVTAWEATLGKHTWRNPSRWDARMLTALTEWGYQPSEVESLLLPHPEVSEEAGPEAESTEDTDEVSGQHSGA